MATSQLIDDLSTVPSIIGNLGLSIAEAQRALNLDHLNGVAFLVHLAKELVDKKEGAAAQKVFEHLLQTCAPSRYQFTKTTLKVRLDLAQSLDVGGAASFGFGFGAVSASASLSMAFGSDYRAAAEVETVLDAIPLSDIVRNELAGAASSDWKGVPAALESRPTNKSMADVAKEILAGMKK
jgi:hypothetical protein